MPKGFLTYNPAAGRFPSHVLIRRAVEVLKSSGWEIFIKQTKGGLDTGELAREAVTEGMDVLFVAGGDGSLNYAIDGLIGSRTALGVLPAGTANVWAKELNLPSLAWTRINALEESAKRQTLYSTRVIDVGKCNNRFFLLWAGVGLDAYIVHRIEPRHRLVKYFAEAHYAASAVISASSWTGMNLHIYADGKEIEGHYILAVVSNIHLYAGGLAEISPAVYLNDGLMDLWLFEGDSLDGTMRLVRDLWSGHHVQSDKAHKLSIRHLRLESDAPLYIQVDGEPIDLCREVEIEVIPRALRVLIPESTSRKLFINDR